jgi:hypothetical protein
LRRKSGHTALLVVHLEPPNFTPRALPGRICGSNAAIIEVLTGPNNQITFARKNTRAAYLICYVA